jgi:hypothetical protein
VRQNQPPVRVELIGSSQRGLDTLDMVFKGPMKGLCEFGSSATADAVIIDLDGIGALAQWEKYRRKFPLRPAIVLSVKGDDIPNADEILSKPIKVEAFCAAMKRVAAKILQSQTVKVELTTNPFSSGSTTDSRSRNYTRSITAGNEPSTQKVPVLAQKLEHTITLAINTPPIAAKDYKEVCGKANDIDVLNLQQCAALIMPLKHRLLGAVINSIATSEKQQTGIEIYWQGTLMLRLFPAQQAALCLPGDDKLRELCAQIFPENVFELKPVTGSMPDWSNPLTLTQEALLWKMAAWTYCGKLPLETQLQERVYLQHWPNLTRLLELPNAMRISALLIDHPMTLVRVAEALAIPQRHVFAFYAAAHTIGLMGNTKRNSDYLLENLATPPDASNRKLFGKIIRHLRELLS